MYILIVVVIILLQYSSTTILYVPFRTTRAPRRERQLPRQLHVERVYVQRLGFRVQSFRSRVNARRERDYVRAGDPRSFFGSET